MKKRIVRTLKIIFIPMILTILITIITAFGLRKIVTKTYKNLYLENSLNLNELNIALINGQREKAMYLSNALERMLRNSAQLILEHSEDLTNDYLEIYSDSFEYTSVILFDERGEFLNYTINKKGLSEEEIIEKTNRYENYVPSSGDPIDIFIKSGLDYMYLENWPSKLENQKCFFYLMKDEKTGQYIHISRISKTVQSFIESIDYNSVLNKMEKVEKVVSVYLLDNDLNTLAKSENSNMTKALETPEIYKEVFEAKEIKYRIRFSKNHNARVLEVVSPICEKSGLDDEFDVLYIISALYSIKDYEILKKTFC